MTGPFEEPSIPARVQRPLAAIWVSLGLHLALIALVQVAPPGAGGADGRIIEARLVSTAHPVAKPAPVVLQPIETPDAVQVRVRPEDPADTHAVESSQTPPGPPAVEPPEPPVEAVAAEPAVAPVAEPPPAAPVTLTSAVDLTYYGAREVDVHPRAVAEIVPTYPEAADRQKLSGKVVLQLKLEADGRVIDAEVVRATPPDVFDDAAVEAFRQARFTPAIKAGHPVRALMLIEVVFDWAGRPLSPAR